MSIYKVSDYDYYLPEELIAQEPLTQRDTSRLMVVNKESSNISHHHFSEILEYLQEGDTLVINDTKVLPARLYGVRKVTGAKIEVLLLKQIEKDNWEVLVKPGKKARVGESILFFNGDNLVMEGVIMDKSDDGGHHIKFTYQGQFIEVLDQIGAMPLPPYIKKKLEDKERYQTVYASKVGSAAAPTAGLHFTPELLQSIKGKGINIAKVLLHVGLGTFRPVKAEDIREHHMHSEFYQVTPEAAEVINCTKKNGGRVIAVGTTSVRTLETQSGVDGILHPGSGWTDIFIYPGYKFKCADGLVTNFHLPKSTLLMLVSAFAGREKILKAYETAVEEKYRFFSFGDAMLII